MGFMNLVKQFMSLGKLILVRQLVPYTLGRRISLADTSELDQWGSLVLFHSHFLHVKQDLVQWCVSMESCFSYTERNVILPLYFMYVRIKPRYDVHYHLGSYLDYFFSQLSSFKLIWVHTNHGSYIGMSELFVFLIWRRSVKTFFMVLLSVWRIQKSPKTLMKTWYQVVSFPTLSVWVLCV